MAARSAKERREQQALDRERMTRLDAMEKTRFDREESKYAREQEQAEKLNEARQSAYGGGDGAALMQAAPQEAYALQQSQQASAATAAKVQQEASAKRQEATANAQRWAAEALRRNPGSAQQIQAKMEQLASGPNPTIERFELPTQPLAQGLHGPEAIDAEGLGAVGDATLAAMGKAPKYEGPEDAISKAVTLSSQLRPGDQGFQEAYVAERDREEARELARRRAGATNVAVGGGGVGLTTAAQTNQQGEVIKARLRLKQLGNMRNAIDAAGGYGALGAFRERGEAGFSEFVSKAGGKVDENMLANRASAVAAIGGFTNPIVSELAGANVPPNEWKRMTQSLPDPENDSAPVLKAKIDAWEQNLKIIDEFGVDYLINGITTGERDWLGGGPKKKAAIKKAVSVAVSSPEAAANSGKTPEQVADEMNLPPEQRAAFIRAARGGQ